MARVNRKELAVDEALVLSARADAIAVCRYEEERLVFAEALHLEIRICVQGEGMTATARLGNFIFSQSSKVNAATMSAFKAALENEYGSLGTHAFDTVVGSRAITKRSLRACDVTATLSRLDSLRRTRFIGELSRQMDTSPKFRELSDGMRKLVRSTISDSPVDCNLKKLSTDADLAKAATQRIDRAIEVAKDFVAQKKLADPNYNVDEATHALDARKTTTMAVADDEPTGLRNLRNVFEKGTTSIEDRIKRGFIGAGMRVNRSNTNPVILEALKTNGVEPGFIYRNDWSKDDTHGFMSDVNSEASRKAMDELMAKSQSLAAKCKGKSLREQILLAGRAHPAAMAAASELLIEKAAKLVRSAENDGKSINDMPNTSDSVKLLAKAIKMHFFSNKDDIVALASLSEKPAGKVLHEAKLELFTSIRDAVMVVNEGDAEYSASTVFRHFSDRAIVELDYNEGCKFTSGDSAHAGTFMRPERILNNRLPVLGQIYRFQTRSSADKISAGAVTEPWPTT